MNARPAILLALAALMAGTPALGQQPDQLRGEQGDARREAQAGNIMRSGEIEAKILPQMRNAEYLGFAYDSTARAYRLKFIRDGRVTYVDVDARTGKIIGRSR